MCLQIYDVACSMGQFIRLMDFTSLKRILQCCGTKMCRTADYIFCKIA